MKNVRIVISLSNCFLFTWDTLYKVSRHSTEVSSDVFEDLHVFVILSFQKHPGQVHILKKERAQGQGITFQRSISAERERRMSLRVYNEREWTCLANIMHDKILRTCH